MNIPSQLTESAYLVFEPHLLRALRAWPTETEFPTAIQYGQHNVKVSGSTFAARFRDAIVSVQRFQWETHDESGNPNPFILEKLRSIAGTYAVGFDPAGSGSVWFRARGRKGRPSALVTENREAGYLGQATPDRTAWKNTTYDEQKAVCVLIHHGRMEGPVVVEGEIPVEAITEFEGSYNVAITFDSTNNKTVIL